MLTSCLGGGAQLRARKRLAAAVICAAFWSVAACGGGTAKHGADASEGGSVATPSANAGTTSATGNAAQTSGAAGLSGAASGSASGGSASGGSASGGAANAGSSSKAGAPPANAGNGGATDNGGGAPGEMEGGVVPSPGCARAEPSGPESDGTVRYVLPPTYDGKTPLPLVFLLHATNITNDVQRLTTDARSAEYVLAGPQAVGTSLGTFENGTPDIEALLTKVLSQVCADQNHVFAAGNGSGGRAVMSWVAKHQKLAAASARLRAAAMVGTYYGNGAPQLPVLFIHSTQSNNSRAVAQDEDGMKAAKKLATLNGCGETTTPVEAASCMVNQMPVDPGCVDYQGCTQPFRFCHHDDLSNQSSGDPWTCIATSAIFDFFEPYR